MWLRVLCELLGTKHSGRCATARGTRLVNLVLSLAGLLPLSESGASSRTRSRAIQIRPVPKLQLTTLALCSLPDRTRPRVAQSSIAIYVDGGIFRPLVTAQPARPGCADALCKPVYPLVEGQPCGLKGCCCCYIFPRESTRNSYFGSSHQSGRGSRGPLQPAGRSFCQLRLQCIPLGSARFD